MSPTNHFTLPLRSSMAQQGKRQREDSDGESQAKRVRWADSEPEWGQQADLPSSHTEIDNNHDDGNDNDDDEIVENVVKVLVENDSRQFFVREDTICARSGLFRAMVSSFSRGEEKVVRLPTISSDEFRMYIRWLKTKRVSLKTWFDRTGRNLNITEQEELQAYMDIYVLAESFDDLKLRRFVMKVFIKNCPDLSTIPGSEWCTLIWKQTSQGSVLRAFLVEWTFFRYAWLAKSEQFAREALSYPEEFREEFAKLASEKGLPPSGNRPNNVAKKAFQDAMRARLLKR